MSEIIQLTETARLCIVQDESRENPRKGWAMVTGFAKVRGRGDSRIADVEPVHHWAELDEAIGRLLEVEEQVPRWARIFHGMHVEYDSEHGGFWFVDPQQMAENWPGPDYPEGRSKLEQEAEVIRQEQETYRQWADGEVYGVILERGVLVETKRTHADGSVTYERDDEAWEGVESLWGCYLDDDYTAQVVADEHFDLSDEESAALGLDAPVG
jgi:hypothetical protein